MTRGRGIMGIFRQKWYFSKVLVVWETRVQTLVVKKVIQKKGSSLGWLNCIFS